MIVRILSNGKVSYIERYIDPYTGKRKQVSVTYDKDTARNRKEAQRILYTRLEGVNEPVALDITLKRLIVEYRKDLKLTVKESTYRRNGYALQAVEKILGGDVIVNRMTARYVRNRFLETGKDRKTLNGYLKRFKTLIIWGYENDLIDDKKAVDKLKKFPEEATEEKKKYMESEELELLLENLTHPIWKLLIEFLALSGLRCGEMIALEKADVDLDAKVIHVNKTWDTNNNTATSTKTLSSTDDVHIQPQLEAVIHKINAAMLQQRLRYQYTSDLFVCSTDGTHVKYYALNKYLKENTERVLGYKLTTHSLRHTHASLLFEEGFTLDEVARRLRHGDSAVTREVYIHVTQRLKEKDATKLDKIMLLAPK